MSYPPGQELTVRSDGIGLVQDPNALPLVVGYAKGLTANQLYQSSNPNTFRDLAQAGPVLETALAAIQKSGAAMILAVAASVAATTSSVDAARVDSSTGTVAVSGTPVLAFDAAVELTKSGAKGVARFKYTLDGETYSPERIVPLGGTFAMPGSDLTLTFEGTPNSSAVTKSGSGPDIALSGEGGTDSSYVLTISTAGVNGTAQFGLTRDGAVVVAAQAVPTTPFTYAVPGTTSLVITFDNDTWVLNETYSFTTATSLAGDFEVGDVHSFTTTAPHYSTSDLAAAVAELRSQLGLRRVRRTIFTGQQASASAGATMFAAVATHLADLEGDHYFGRGLMDCGGSTADEFRSAYAAAADNRVGIVWRRARCIVRATFDGYSNAWQPGVRAVAERAFEADLSENLGRVASLNMSWVTEVDHDEGSNQIFVESDKVITFRTHQGQTGFFVTNGYLRSPVGSDFLYWDWGTVIDELCESITEGQQKWLLSKLRSLTDGTGRIAKADAVRVKAAVKSLIDSRLKDPINIEGQKGHVSDVAYEIDLTNDFLATRTVKSTGAAVSLSPIETFVTEVGLARSI